MLRIGRSSEKIALPLFSAIISKEIINVPHHNKVKIPSMDLFDGTINLVDNLSIHKLPMYIYDVDKGS